MKTNQGMANGSIPFTYRIFEDTDVDDYLRSTILAKANRQEKVDQRNKAANIPQKKLMEAIASFSEEERARTVGDVPAMMRVAREIIARAEV